MYGQLIAIFVILGIFAFLHIVTLILIIYMLKSGFHKSSNPVNDDKPNDVEGVGVVFCKKCKTGFDSKYTICPKCGMPR